MQGKRYERALPRYVSDSNRRIIETNSPPKLVYQVWKGSNKFFLRWRLIFGPDVRSLVLTVCLIVIPVILFVVFVSQKLIKEFNHQVGSLIVAIPVIFAAYDIVVLFMTSGRDPGIVPRNSHPPEPEDNGGGSPTSSDWAGSTCSFPTLPPTKDVLVNGIIVKVKYCHTCMLYRPPRCSHCSICNNCVERFDHHCPWVGQCIGRRNYRFFFMFISSTALLCLYVFAFCWVNLKKIMDAHECSLWRALVESPVSGVLIVYTFIAAWFVGGLTAFHIYLICSNQTTYENFRYRYDGKLNPYNHGCTRNMKDIFCSEIPKSMNNFRAKVKEDSSAASYSLRPIYSPDVAKRSSFEYEVGGKRQAVAAEEFEDIQSQISSIGGLERCGAQPPRSSWGSRKGNWDNIPHDIEGLPSEFSMDSVGFEALGEENIISSNRILSC